MIRFVRVRFVECIGSSSMRDSTVRSWRRDQAGANTFLPEGDLDELMQGMNGMDEDVVLDGGGRDRWAQAGPRTSVPL